MDSTEVLSADDLQALLAAGAGAQHQHELVAMPEWGKAVWVWSYDMAAELAVMAELRRQNSDDAENANRAAIERVIQSVRVSGEVSSDGTLPPRLFDRLYHTQWLGAQPIGVINRICEVSQRLNGEARVTQERLSAFFAMLPTVVGCLRHIGSVCAACTDCPRSSQPTCPSVLCEQLFPLMA